MSITEKDTSLVSPQEFYAETEAAHLPPLWQYLHKLITTEPQTDTRPYVWRWEDIYARMLKAGEIPIDRGSERRVLILNNPGLSHLYTTTRTIYAGVQMVKPGEIAPAHRHLQSAIRYIIQGNGAYTAVEGQRCYMEEHDLLLTPPWQWHDHGNESNAPVLWMDGLDINLLKSLDVSFYEPYPEDRQPITKPDDLSRRTFGGGFLRPAWVKPQTAPGGSSPLLIYKWSKTYEALRELASAGEASPYDDVALTYTNPWTGGPVLPTMSCTIQMLRPGIHTQAHRHTTSAVYHVVDGSGFTIINGQKFEWKKGDFLALPPWAWHEHANASPTSEAILFSVTDAPVFEALGLYREQAYPENNGYQKPGP